MSSMHDVLRRPQVKITSFGSNYLRVINPYMPLWWGMAMPGAGHIMLGKRLKGFFLFLFEFVVNTESKLNLAIVYSCTGHFDMAKQCLDIKWFFIYIGVYIFNIWDAYRLATDINQLSQLAARLKAPIPGFQLSLFEINYFQKLSVWIPVFWSIITPGLGHLIIRNITTGLYLSFWLLITLYQSNLLSSFYYTCNGDYVKAIAALDPQWALYLPSLCCFAVCDSYYHAITLNSLFKMEQARYLENNYWNQANRRDFLKILEKK